MNYDHLINDDFVEYFAQKHKDKYPWDKEKETREQYMFRVIESRKDEFIKAGLHVVGHDW